MGTHPTSPSLVLSTNGPLSSHLAAHPELMGQKVIRRFESQGAERGNLPFLFKILSVGKALSIQAHPDKKKAEEFHKRLPGIYKGVFYSSLPSVDMGLMTRMGGQDDNHKPEMALAITPFRALCGFRPLNEIAAYLRSTPELAALLPHDVLTTFLDISSSSSTPTGLKEKSALKALFGALMTTAEEKVKSQLDLLVSRYRSTPPPDKEIVDLVLLLSSHYPHDIGILCAFLLNHIHLSPGSAIFLGAGEPHAYLSGDCIECMANSDNVIRAGLTPKLRDVESLIGCLTYEAGEGGRHAVSPREWERGQGELYDPPVPEFAVLVGRVGEGKEERWGGVEGPSIVLVSEGRGEVVWDGDKGRMEIGKGDAFFVGAGTEVVLRGGEEEVVLYRAFVEV